MNKKIKEIIDRAYTQSFEQTKCKLIITNEDEVESLYHKYKDVPNIIYTMVVL